MDITKKIVAETGLTARALFNALKDGATKKGEWHYTQYKEQAIRFKMEAIPFYGLPKKYCPRMIKVQAV